MSLTTISRRAAIAWGAAAIAAPSAALANAQCSAPDSSGMKRCVVNFGSDSRDAVRQLKPHWCWAACIQTIFATHGFDISQQQIVQKVFGDQVDQSANAKEILAAIDGRWTNDHGKSFQAKGFILWDRVADFERPDALPAAVRELQGGNPLIFANDRHTMVLTSLAYSENARGDINVNSLTVRDPWPDAPYRHVLGADEVAKSGLLCGVHVDVDVA
jgi:hypothetical protein